MTDTKHLSHSDFQRGQASGGATAKSGAAAGKGAAVVLSNAERALGRTRLALQYQEAAWARGEAALGGLRGAQAAQAGELLATRDALLGQLGRCEHMLQTAFTRLVRRGKEMAAGQLAADSTLLPQIGKCGGGHAVERLLRGARGEGRQRD